MREEAWTWAEGGTGMGASWPHTSPQPSPGETEVHKEDGIFPPGAIGACGGQRTSQGYACTHTCSQTAGQEYLLGWSVQEVPWGEALKQAARGWGWQPDRKVQEKGPGVLLEADIPALVVPAGEAQGRQAKPLEAAPDPRTAVVPQGRAQATGMLQGLASQQGAFKDPPPWPCCRPAHHPCPCCPTSGCP